VIIDLTGHRYWFILETVPAPPIDSEGDLIHMILDRACYAAGLFLTGRVL
jgi:hypothetical protein